MNLKCFFGKHNWKIKGLYDRCHWEFPDHKGNTVKQYFLLTFYECACCAKRQVLGERDVASGHGTAKTYREIFVRTGMMPEGSKSPFAPPPKPDAKLISFPGGKE